MTVGELIKTLNEVKEENGSDIPIKFMGADGVVFFVTGQERDYVLVEESINSFNNAFSDELDDCVTGRPDFAKIIWQPRKEVK